MIGITGSSGKLGINTIEQLLEKGVKANEIIAIGRDESKLEQFKEKGIQIRKADYDNYQELVKAFQGVDKLLFISSNEIEKRLKQHKDIINAAKESNVKYIAYTSMVRKSDDDTSPVSFIESCHIDTEKIIKDCGIPYTILQNGLYTDCLTEYFFGPKVLENGIFFPAEKGTSNYVTRKDLAEATANIILSSDKYQNKTLVLSGTETPTLDDAIKILSQIANKELTYTSPDINSYKQALLNFGTPQMYVDFSVAFALAIKDGEFNTINTDLPQVLGRNSTPLSSYLIEFYKPK